MSRKNRSMKTAQRGVALIEVLVGILIFSIGVLGLIGLQTAMTRAQTIAKFRADATLVANEVVGTMWADRLNLGQYKNTGGSSSCGSNARCDDWVKKVAATLPGGVASISTVTDTTGGTVTVSVSWTTSIEGTSTYAMVTSIR